MDVIESTRTRTTKTVTIAAGSQEEAVKYALLHAGETEGSIFGKTVDVTLPGIFVVTLFTD